ncbi:MAG: HEAT repeat domain-containing protein [Acidobacteria bacterium]|nr:HEAT repeat domain-containing protein [Acidobacteriota bacterium]
MSNEQWEHEEDVPVREKPLSLWIAEFFFIPLAIVALCVGLFFLFSFLTSEGKTAKDYLMELKAGSGNRRWQAAYELSKIMWTEKERAKARALAPDMARMFEEARDDDPRVRRYLALTLGHLGDGRAIPALVRALQGADNETRLYSIWALGALEAREAVPELMSLLQDEDQGIRKMSVYVLGELLDPRALEPLRVALGDRADDVRWNAAVALARLRDASGLSQLVQMMDRSYLNRVPELSEEQKAEVMVSAIKALRMLGETSVAPQLEQLKSTDPNMQVRQAAIESLKELR